MNKWCLTTILLLQCAYAWSETPTLTASVKKTWTVERARNEALANLLPFIDVSGFQPIDPNYQQNLKARVKHQAKMGTRTITVFDDHSYSVSEDCAPIGYYYTPKGKLEAVEYPATSAPRCPGHYPNKEYKYSYPDGQLMNISLNVAADNSFMFSPNGHLEAHWKGDYCREKNGSFCGARHSYIETIRKSYKK